MKELTWMEQSNGNSCYNTNCNVGIVLIRHDIALGMSLVPVSTRGDWPKYYTKIGLVKVFSYKILFPDKLYPIYYLKKNRV